MLSSHSNMAAGSDDKKETGAKQNESAVPTISSKSLPTNISELLWEEKQRSLRELVSNYRLPLAVKLRSKCDISQLDDSKSDNDSVSTAINISTSDVLNGALRVSSNNNNESRKHSTSLSIKSGDSSGSGREHEETILQLHEIRKKKIILARKMTWEKRQNDYVVTGEQVEIPASFRGWLEVVPDDGRPVEYFDTVAGITSIKPRSFLVRTSTVGYELHTEENGSSCWMPNEIKPGEVLTTGIIYMDNKKNKNATQRNIFKRLLKQNKTKSKDQDLKYLQCFDSQGHEIMIPLIMSGVFSPVGDASIANYDAVYELQDLIMAFGLPVNAQLIHSNSKEEYKCPKGVLRLYGTREEEMVVVSRVNSDGALFSDTSESPKVEIPVDKELLFSRGVVKKKPAIKAKLVDVFPSQWDKDPKHVIKLGDSATVKNEREYSRSKSAVENEYKLRNVYDRRLSAPATNKSKPVTTYGSPMATSSRPRDTQQASSLSHYSIGCHNASTSQPPITIISHPQYTSTSHNTSTTTSYTSSKDISNSTEPQSQTEQTETIKKNVELPAKVPPKELKKSKSTGILDKLSVRKVKKERAKLKELKGDDVFSKRIVRQDLSYREFFNGLGDDDEETKSPTESKVATNNSTNLDNNNYQTLADKNHLYGANNDSNMDKSQDLYRKPGTNDSVSAHALQRKKSIQNRDLPPIPPESPHHSDSHDAINSSKDSLYEHLPPAPTPPRATESPQPGNAYGEHDEEDGYMMPVQIQEQKALYSQTGVRLRNKPPASRDTYRNSRARKTRSEIPQNAMISPHAHNDGCPIDIDGLFSFAYNSNDMNDGRHLGSLGGQAATSTSQLYGYNSKPGRVPAWTSDIPDHEFDLEQRFVDNLDLQTRSNTPGYRQRNRSSKAMNANPNATIRSHNIRKMQQQQQQHVSAMELFHFTDSFRDLAANEERRRDNYGMDSLHNPSNYHPKLYDESNNYLTNSRPPLLNSRSADASMHHYQPPPPPPPPPQQQQQQQQQQLQQHHQQQQQQQNIIYGPSGYGYPESEPAYRPASRQMSTSGGIYEPIYVKQGDDSAISMCSRGEGGFQNGSEYSYNEHSDYYHDDGWSPPDNVEGMTVQEVSKSLRYIGMKDRVVLRFSNEQIDGSMLCTLDKKLLKEGFPELNALELKKIIDFVQGWRPKKA